jgi:ATP-dependent Clp protease adaptor protein ClpS
MLNIDMAIERENSTVVERRTQKIKPPPMYQVILLNDDYTPMDFVIIVLQEYFNKDRETAVQIMLKVHNEGKGICGVFSRDIATTKVDLVMAFARQAGHPLQCVMEEI